MYFQNMMVFDDFQSGDKDYDCTDLELQDILGQLNCTLSC